MNRLAVLVLENRVIAALFASLGAAIPPLGLVGGAAAGLVSLNRGVQAGLLAAGFGAVIAAALGFVLNSSPVGGILLVAATTVPVCLLAGLLRRSRSLTLTVQIAFVGACISVAAFVWLVGDVAALWRRAFELWLQQAGAQGLDLSASERSLLEQRMPFAVLTGSAMANWVLFSLGALFLARSAQARLFNPGGFQRAFHGLSLGKVLLVASALVLVAYALTRAVMPLNVLAVLLAGWLLQGLAVVHNLVALYQLSGWWLVVSYGALAASALIASPLMLVFPLLGSLDETIGLRARLKGGRDKALRRDDNED